jgi:hypothetical protein
MDESRDSTRREFLQGVKRWSAAVAALAITGGTLDGRGNTAAAWVNGTWANRSAGWVNRYGGGGAWVNGAGGWVNRAGGWVNGGGGGGAWANRGGGGTAGWVNRYGGGGAAWVNR